MKECALPSEPLLDRLMEQALREACLALDEGEVPIGAVVAHGVRIVGRGHNRTEALRDVTAHAEMQAITAAAQTLGGKYLNECTLCVTVEPCLMCCGAIGWSQLGCLVWGAPDPRRGFTSLVLPSKPVLHPSTKVISGIRAGECLALMRDFFKSKR